MEREILTYNCFRTGYGTHHYDVKYKGEWEDMALINCVDRGIKKPTDEQYKVNCNDCGCNYGGYVEKVYTDEETGITRARVGVYYD